MFKLNVDRMAAYILFEHAAGYALFKNIAMEDIGSQLDQVCYLNISGYVSVSDCFNDFVSYFDCIYITVLIKCSVFP